MGKLNKGTIYFNNFFLKKETISTDNKLHSQFKA